MNLFHPRCSCIFYWRIQENNLILYPNFMNDGFHGHVRLHELNGKFKQPSKVGRINSPSPPSPSYPPSFYSPDPSAEHLSESYPHPHPSDQIPYTRPELSA